MIRNLPFLTLLLCLLGINLAPNDMETLARQLTGQDVSPLVSQGVIAGVIFVLYVFRGFGRAKMLQNVNVYASGGQKTKGLHVIWQGFKSLFGFPTPAVSPEKRFAEAFVTLTREAGTPEAAVELIMHHIAAGNLMFRAAEVTFLNTYKDLSEAAEWSSDPERPTLDCSNVTAEVKDDRSTPRLLKGPESKSKAS